MKRVFLVGVIVYSAISLLLVHWPAMAGATGAASAPWLAMMVIDMAFAAFAVFKLVGPAFFSDDADDETSIHAEDVNVPDTWLYGLFGLNLFGNCAWHAYKSVMTTDFESVYNSVWFMAEIAALPTCIEGSVRPQGFRSTEVIDDEEPSR